MAALTETQTPLLKPGYFLVRPSDGAVVPLIPVDELPFDLQGVCKTMDIIDTIGMLNLGLVKGSGLKYEVVEQKAPKSVSAAVESTPITTKQIKDVERSASFLPSPSPSLPNRPKPYTCRHWCAHGKCRWSDKCRYLHEMPLTIQGLASVGLSDWPIWFRAQNPELFTTIAPRISATEQTSLPEAIKPQSNVESSGSTKSGNELLPKKSQETVSECGYDYGSHSPSKYLASSSAQLLHLGRVPHSHQTYTHPFPYPPSTTRLVPLPRLRSRHPFSGRSPSTPDLRATAAELRRVMRELHLSNVTRATPPASERLRAAEGSLRDGVKARLGVEEVEVENRVRHVIGSGRERERNRGRAVDTELESEAVKDARDWEVEEDGKVRLPSGNANAIGNENENESEKRRAAKGKGKDRLVDV